MKKFFITIYLVAIFCFSTFAQLLEKKTYDNLPNYKKHYSHNIEGGTIDGIQREFVIGNERDYLPYNQRITGQSVTGNIIGLGKVAKLISGGSIALTDFAVLPSTENQYAVGTGIFYPNAPIELSGYPFLGIYDRKTMDLLQLYYYDLSYPLDKDNKNSVGLRIKYSERYNSVYISGILCENILPQMNMNELVGRSQGFIMKVNFANPTTGQVRIFTPDDLTIIPLLCAVTDIEIDPNEQEIIFTGINTKQQTTGYYSPFAGKIDMNLNFIWSKTFSIDGRYSGVDVEYSENNNFLMLMNSDNKEFAVMEISNTGQVLQQPVKYLFSYLGDTWPARSHIMHYNKSNIFITGNLFEAERTQRLYSYEILDATNLSTGAPNFQMYSYYPIPQGKQVEATTYWAPENSILSNGFLSIVGIYNNIGQGDNALGYCLIHQAGFDKECIIYGDVTKSTANSSSVGCLSRTTTCTNHLIPFGIEQGLPTEPHQFCPTLEKSSDIMNIKDEKGWRINSTNGDGLVITFNNSEESSYLVNIYTCTGQLVHSEKVNANGQKSVYLKFKTSEQIYLVNVNDGIKSETKKIVVLH